LLIFDSDKSRHYFQVFYEKKYKSATINSQLSYIKSSGDPSLYIAVARLSTAYGGKIE